MKKIYHIILLMAAFMLPSCSCEKEEAPENLLETVPADAKAVAVFDIDAFIKAAGNVDDVTNHRLEMILTVAETIEKERLTMFVSSSGKRLLTFRVKDLKAFETLMTDNGAKTSEEDDYKIYRYDALSIAVKGNQGWMMDGGVNAGNIDKILEKASKSSIAAIKTVTDFLGGEGMMRLCVSSSVLKSKRLGADGWMCATISSGDNTLTTEIYAIKADGARVDFSGGEIKPIDASFLRYVPQSAIAVAAVGVTSQFDWDRHSGTINDLLDLGIKERLALNLLLPYLKSIDGTVAVALSQPDDLAASLDDAAAWHYLLGVQIASDNAAELKSIVADNLPEVNVSIVDGWLILSNRVISQSASSSQFEEVLSGSEVAVAAHLPAGNRLLQSAGFPHGLDVSIIYKDKKCVIELSLDDAVAPPLETLISFLLSK